MNSKSVRSLLDALSKREPGPQPTFQKFEFIDLLLILDEEKLIGRKKLSERLGLGEGVVRTMLQRLKSKSLIEVYGKGGCSLSKKGVKLVNELKETIRAIGPIEANFPWQYSSNYALIVKNVGEKIKKGLEQRDEAIKAGARALMILTYRNGKLLMPGVSDLTSEQPDFALQLIRIVKPEHGDVILIAAGESLLEARKGALAAAQTFL
ncbi:MAG: DUF4443 domain-containing protein [Thaumarchaeota archaeon]|nr:DUF4443 domain-containing protein [Nitrososphaerota archaeon]